MAEVTLTIDDTQVDGCEGISILEIAKENSIAIPTLCYTSELPPIDACRICTVEKNTGQFLSYSNHSRDRHIYPFCQTSNGGIKQAKEYIMSGEESTLRSSR